MTGIDLEINRRYAEWLLSKAIPNGECLECHFADAGRGYRVIRGGGQAHRFVCNVFHGPILNGLWALHTCDNRACINPKHLYIGTRQDNVNDMVERGRHKAERSKMFTPEQELEMRNLRTEGWSYNRLAAKYLVTKQTIFKYVKNQRGYYANQS